MLKKLLLLLIIVTSLFTISSCQKIEENPEKTIENLKKIDKYICDVIITTSNDCADTTYDCRQYYDREYGQRLDLNDERIIVYGLNDIRIGDLNNGVVYSGNPDYDQVFKLSFLEEYIGLLYTNEEIEYSFIEENDTKYQLIKMDLPGNNRNLASAVMYVNLDDTIPAKIIVYDYKGNKRILYTFLKFDTEVELEEEIFKVESTMQ
ncbi:germination lipoprotein GerS-related protein [Clostridium sp. DL1XJH146]